MHAYYFSKKKEDGVEEISGSKRQEIRPTIQLLRNYFRSKKAVLVLVSRLLLLEASCY